MEKDQGGGVVRATSDMNPWKKPEFDRDRRSKDVLCFVGPSRGTVPSTTEIDFEERRKKDERGTPGRGKRGGKKVVRDAKEGTSAGEGTQDGQEWRVESHCLENDGRSGPGIGQEKTPVWITLRNPI